jgi:hypothetical protein
MCAATTADIGRRHSSPAIVGIGDFLALPSVKTRRPTIFTIAEGYEFDEEENAELRRRESITYSSSYTYSLTRLENILF